MFVLMLLLLPLRWMGAVVIAAAGDEFGHYAAVCCLGGSVSGMRIGTKGAVLTAFGLTHKQDIICLIAGPLAGLLLGLTFRWFPVIAVCAIFQSLYNLLPIYPLDGGKILRSICFMQGWSSRFCRAIEYSVIFLMLAASVYVKIRLGISLPIAFYFGILLIRKIPCKQKKDWI